MTKTAVVLGATGLVGAALVDQLLASSAFSHATALTRRPLGVDNGKLSNPVIDFNQLESAAAYIQGDVLFSCLGTTKKQAGSIKAQRRVDVDYQCKVAEIAANNGMSHYCLVSSSGANSNSASPYLAMKGALEVAVKGLSFQRISIFQPSLLTGHRREARFGEKLGTVMLPLLCHLPMLQRYRPIKGSDVALKVLQVSLAEGEGVEYFTLDQVFPE